jgi:hypothetical protein
MTEFNGIYKCTTNKHKRRPFSGVKGNQCPEWSQRAGSQNLRHAPANHNWSATEAQEMLKHSEAEPKGGKKRYATKNGIAFAAHDSNDGTWHGFPVAWNEVPAELKDKWVDEGKVTTRSLKKYKDFPNDNVTWALDSDNE